MLVSIILLRNQTSGRDALMKPIDTSFESAQIQIEALRRLGREGRLRAGINLTRTSRKLLLEGIIRRHPDYNDNQIRLAYLKLLLPDELFLAAYPEAENILP